MYTLTLHIRAVKSQLQPLSKSQLILFLITIYYICIKNDNHHIIVKIHLLF